MFDISLLVMSLVVIEYIYKFANASKPEDIKRLTKLFGATAWCMISLSLLLIIINSIVN